MKLGVGLTLLGITALFITGCLEFERQTVSYRHDKAADAIYIYQDYQGIFGADNPALMSNNEIDQLASVMQGQRTFFFNNWITEFNRASLVEMRDKPKGELDPNEDYEKSIRALLDLALDNVKVENVGLYLNADKKVSGTQRVTAKNISKIVAALNKMLLFAARGEAAKEEISDADKKALLKFVDSNTDVIRLDGNQLEFRWPMSEKDYREAAEELKQHFAASGGEMRYVDGLMVLTIGKKHADVTIITLPFSKNTYSPNVLNEAKRYGLKDSFDPAKAAAEFLKK